MKRLFDRDDLLGITRYFHFDELTNEATISTHQDYEPIIEDAKRHAIENSGQRWGNGRVVARVPIQLYNEWAREGKHLDDAFLRRWCNDPDNKYFRTFQGKI